MDSKPPGGVAKNACTDANGMYHNDLGQFASKGDNQNINPNYKKELYQVIEKAKKYPNERQKLVIGKVTDKLVKEAQQHGHNIENYNHDIDVSGTRHTYKNHDNKKREADRGLIAITDTDFENIPDIIYNYDEIIWGEFDDKGTPLIKYKKSMEDGTTYYVEEIRTRQKTLTIKSMYKTKKADNSCIFTDFNPQRFEHISTIIITDIYS